MLRVRLVPLLAMMGLLVSCSPRTSSADEPPRRPPEPAAVPSTPPPGEVELRDPRETMLAATTVALLENEHLLRRKIDDPLSREAFKIYVERLDSGKMFLLAQHAKALDPHADRIDDELRSGRLDLAHEGARLFVLRVAVVDRLVAEILAQPLDLTDQEFFETDPKKLQLATTEAELRDRWRRRLELEVIERVSAMEVRLAEKQNVGAAKKKGAAKKQAEAEDGEDADAAASAGPADKIPPTPLAREAKARADLALRYAGRFARLRTPSALGAAADLINAVAAALDPHTTYLPPADRATFDIQMTGSLEGIGAVLRERDHLTEIVELVPGGASWRQGKLAPGDLILSVSNDGREPVDVSDMHIEDVVKMIRGPKGTVVKLRIRKPTLEEETVAITRDVVVIEETFARGALLRPGKGRQSYGYIFLPSFYGGSGSGQRTATEDVRHLLGEMRDQKVAGVVIDIRSNGGGLLRAAIDITGLLVDTGPVVQVRNSAGRREVLADRDRGTAFDGPVVVLVDRFSASASEIVAAALQDYQRAVVVGTGLTHGKGTVQSLADLDRMTGSAEPLGVLKLTIQQFFRVNGASTQREGVAPDVVLPDPVAFVDAGERQLEHAIPWSQIEAVAHDDARAGWNKQLLAAHSAARIAGNKVFAKIVSRSRLLRSWRDDTLVPLARPAWEARREAHKAALDATSADLQHAPARFAVKLLDEPAATPAPGPGGKIDDRRMRWSENLARDPWVEESLSVLADMTQVAAR